MAADNSGSTFHASRPHHTEKQEEKKQISLAPTRPPVDYREYREKKERERLERPPSTVAQTHASDINKHHSHHHKSMSNANVMNKHPLPPGQKPLHHNHHHRLEVKVGQSVPQRPSSSQPRDPNRDPSRQRLQSGINSTLHSHSHAVPKEPNLDNSMADSVTHRSDVGTIQESNMQEKLSNNNHSVHRLSGVESKHQGHDKRMYDPRHKLVEHRKDNEQKTYKYPDPPRADRQRKSDTLEQRCEEVRKLIEKPLPPPKPTLDAPFVSNTQKPSHHTKYNQPEKIQSNTGIVSADMKLTVGQNSFSQEKSPNTSNSSSLLTQKSITSKTVSSQHTVHGVSQILKDTIKNGSSQASGLTSLNNMDDPKTEKRLRHDDVDKHSSDIQQSILQTPPGKHKSLFSPEKVPTPRESHLQRSKSKQKTPPSAAKVPKQERMSDASVGFNLVSPFASPPDLQQQETPPVKRSANDVSTTSYKRHRTGSTCESGQSTKGKIEDTSSFEAVKMLGRVPELIQPIRDSASSNGRATQIANDMKPPDLIKPFDLEPTMMRLGSITQQQVSSNQQGLTNGLDITGAKHEPHEFQIKKESYKTEVLIKTEHQLTKGEYLSPMKSAQSISALLQEPLAPMPSLLQGMQQYNQITPQQTQQEQFQQQLHQQQMQQQQQYLPHSILLTDHQVSVQNQCLSLPTVSEPVIASTVDISALSVPVQSSTESIVSVPTSTTTLTVAAPPPEEKKSEHHKSEKKKKKEKHKHKDKDKSKEKHKHKHKDKDKEKHRERDKEKAEETVPAVPIRITIPKDKLNLSTESTTSAGGNAPSAEKNKSPQSTSIKIIIPKERLKGTESVSSSPAQSVVQAPLKIKIRTDGISRSSGMPPTTNSSSSVVPEFTNESRKRERLDTKDNPTASVPPTKKQLQLSSAGYGQHRPGERQNGRHYSSGSNNKVRGGGRGGRQYIGRGPPSTGSAGHYGAPGQRDGYYQQDTYNSNNPRNPHHPHPPPGRGDSGYSRAAHVNHSQSDSYFFANYPPPSMYNPAGYIYDSVLYYSQYQQQYQMYPTGNVIMTSDGAIDTSVPPPSLPPNMRQNQSMAPVASTRQAPKTPPPLPSGPPPSSSPPPPPPPE